MNDGNMPAHKVLSSRLEPINSAGMRELVRATTPARILVGRAGPSYRTATQLALRQDHAAALDAVEAELDLERDFAGEFLHQWQLFDVRTRAADKTEYLLRPGLGRRLSPAGCESLMRRCYSRVDLLVVI